MAPRKNFGNIGSAKKGMRYSLVGNWSGVELALAGLPAALKSSAMWGQRKTAEKFAKMVKDNIKNGKVEGPPKKYNSSDSRSLINDEHYVSSIKAWRQNGVYYAGVKKGVVTQAKSGSKPLEVATLAIIHEQGLGKMPARPVWGPTWAEFGGNKQASKYVTQAILKKAAALKMIGFTIKIGI